MADVVNNSEFWLPSYFLAGDGKLAEKENVPQNGDVDSSGLWGRKLLFQPHFRYGVDLPVESMAGSAEMEGDEGDSLGGLAGYLARSTLRQTEKLAASERPWVRSGSPRSTLSALRSWSGSPNAPSQKSSPPVGSPNGPSGNLDQAWDVISAAASHVARLKMGGGGPNEYSSQPYRHHRRPPYDCSGDLSPLPAKISAEDGHYSSQIRTHNNAQANKEFLNPRQGTGMKNQSSSIWERQAKEAEWIFQQNQIARQQIHHRRESLAVYENGRCGGCPLGLPQSGCPAPQLHPQKQQLQHNRPASGSASRAFVLCRGEPNGRKRESTGTGVFLPRRYADDSESRKNPGRTTVLPAMVVHPSKLNLGEMNAAPQRRFTNGPVPDLDALIARRNAILVEQQKHHAALNCEIRLPQEWTY